jgi:hypothetical protein
MSRSLFLEVIRFPAVMPASWRKQTAESSARELKSSILFGKDVTFMEEIMKGRGPGLAASPILE